MPGTGAIPPKNEVKEYPENWEEMKEKYLEREDEKLKQVLARRKAETQLELEDLASKAIVTRALRASPDYKPLKDRTVLPEPKSEEIHELRKKLNEEIKAIGRRILTESPHEAPPLKGRISQPPSPDWSKVDDE